eukprot:TRINITY_DN22738_c0_g1_i1.p1 TRINITY_DN22738_c0_g1~~TRINITY_DN22738_c0_g1_i1.p1  ORF type:complete len:548 (+),score=102.16 TRINITY_DN22738_c0_g1_i1:38-1645(+)
MQWSEWLWCNQDGCNHLCSDEFEDLAVNYSASSERITRSVWGPSGDGIVECDPVTSGVTSFSHCSHSKWHLDYRTGLMLGSGVTASVFEAFLVQPPQPVKLAKVSYKRPLHPTTCQSFPVRSERRIVVKQIRLDCASIKAGMKEIEMFRAVGLHPNIVRMLESYIVLEEGPVLVMEHCAGGHLLDLFNDFYRSSEGRLMEVSFVKQLLCQILAALQRWIEHRDVKPENLLLCRVSAKDTPRLKLCDFGWSVHIVPGSVHKPLASGVGTVWYASPELNPPVPGAAVGADDFDRGKSDMWSLGVITYLLLCGRNPFHAAKRQGSEAAMHKEVMRLAAFAQLDRNCMGWAEVLPRNAKFFILGLLQPRPRSRMSALEAWRHEFMNMEPFTLDSSSKTAIRAAMQGWTRLDSFQQLCWLALAQAVSESDLVKIPLVWDYICMQEPSCTGYAEGLASMLVFVACPEWFQDRSAWNHVVTLAFAYLDKDSDSMIGLTDLQTAASGMCDRVRCTEWLRRWSADMKHMTFQDFCEAAAAATVI